MFFLVGHRVPFLLFLFTFYWILRSASDLPIQSSFTPFIANPSFFYTILSIKIIVYPRFASLISPLEHTLDMSSCSCLVIFQGYSSRQLSLCICIVRSSS